VKMTLAEFIRRMQEGWGFARPWRVMRIGDALDAVIPQDLRSREVEVEYHSGSSGYGPDFHYYYSWDVRGVRLPAESGRLNPSKNDLVFGYSAKNLPYLFVKEDGFSVGYNR